MKQFSKLLPEGLARTQSLLAVPHSRRRRRRFQRERVRRPVGTAETKEKKRTGNTGGVVFNSRLELASPASKAPRCTRASRRSRNYAKLIKRRCAHATVRVRLFCSLAYRLKKG
ncbi:hypothetical protein EVAR_65775_1 [Eumeta japonica]|uniref:Uncharacterized protein n=1 Tax=Eumeta variegata TaxID=151549 RepID=A0A4C2A3D9_EUMVA|nr:hypothetical protein EVAR_65775_1 [Eumeta japonica]